MAREYNLRPSPGATKSESLTDYDIMPFGKHKGLAMKDVDPQYLLWMWDNDQSGMWRGAGAHAIKVRQYIIDNIAALEMDCPDFDLKHDPRRMK